MALDPPFVVQIETKPGEPRGSFGETMNTVRTWLDHRHIQPVSFLPITNARSGVGFEIGIAFQLFDVTRILAYALSFTAVVLAIETFLVQPLERHVARWRPRPT